MENFTMAATVKKFHVIASYKKLHVIATAAEPPWQSPNDSTRLQKFHVIARSRHKGGDVAIP